MNKDFLGYRGNSALKRPGASFEWTPELLLEYKKCRDDIFYFAENYFKIVTENGLELIKLRDYQREMITAMRDGRFVISCQSRQSGKSETFRIFLTHYILFNDFKTVAILANKGDTAREILSKLQISYQSLPLWLQLSVLDFAKGSFTLENHSRIIATSTSKNSARGFTAHVVILDEMAFIENFEEFYAAVFPVISAGKETKLIITSTPNGLNHFHKFWKGANEGTNGFYPIFVPWNKVPGRDQEWKNQILKGLNNNLEKFAAEFECDFLGSSGTLIAGWRLKQLQGSHKEPIFISEGECLKIYERPLKELNDRLPDGKILISPPHSYVLIADVSRGKGLDYSAFSVIDVSDLPYRQVCAFRDNNIAPADYADIIHRMAQTYNEAQVLVEINDIGEQIGYILMADLEYDNVLCTESAGRAGKKIGFYNGKKSDRGIRTTAPVKLMGCTTLKLLIEQNQLVLNDYDSIDELFSFSRDKNTYKAEPKKFDDLTMGLVLFAWLTNQSYFRQLTNIDTLAALRERNTEHLERVIAPLGFMKDSRVPVRTAEEFQEFTNMNSPWQTEKPHAGPPEITQEKWEGILWEVSTPSFSWGR